MRLIALVVTAAFVAGCAAPARPGEPALGNTAPPRSNFAAPEFRLHILEVSGAAIPPDALDHSARTLARHLGRPVHIIRHDPLNLPEGTRLSTFPIIDDGRLVAAEELARLGGKPLLISSGGDGFLGGVGVAREDDSVWMLPYIEPGTALVVVQPGPERGVTGFSTWAAVAPTGEARVGIVVLHERVIDHRSSWLVSRTKVFEWTLTHELGHVLGVPASSSHCWSVPRLPGRHCTHPECVMYTGLDWRVVVTGILRGWPLDYCTRCSAELDAARNAAAIPPAAPPSPPPAPPAAGSTGR